MVIPFVVFVGIRRANLECKGEWLLSLDDTIYLRGISAYIVIAAHVIRWLEECGINLIRPLAFVVEQLGGIGVLFFFFASGYGMKASLINRKPGVEWIKRRFIRLYVSYLMIKLPLLMIRLIVQQMGLIPIGATITVSSIFGEIVSILFLEDWFVNVIVVQYALFFLASQFGTKPSILIMVIADGVLACIYLYLGRPDRYVNSMWLFIFGVIVALYQNQILRLYLRYGIVVGVVCAVGFIVFGASFAINKGILFANIMKPISGIFACLFFCLISVYYRFGNPVTTWGGKRSLYIYIVHVEVRSILAEFLNEDSVIVGVWLILLVSVVLSAFLYATNGIMNKQQTRQSVM